MIAALVLAGGKSSRMGSPKALLTYRGRTFLDRILDVIGECPEISEQVVVVGAHAREIASTAARVPVVRNPDWELGMTTSFQAGIRALPRGVDGIVVFLVDHPLVLADTVRALLARAGEGDIVVPVCNGRRGHPVLFSGELMREIAALPASLGVNSLVRSDPERVVDVAVDDMGVLVDIDTEDDYRRLTGR